MRCALHTMIACLVLSGFVRAQDVEPIPAEEAHKWAGRLLADIDKANTSPVKIAADANLANGIHVPDRLGVMVIPQKDLKETEELAAQFKSDCGAPLAYLLTYAVRPLVADNVAKAEQLRILKVIDDQGQSHEICVIPLAVKQVADDDYRLQGYGADNKLVIDAKFSQASESGSGSVTISVKDPDEGTLQGTVEVTVFGKYRASFRAQHIEGN